MLIDKPRRLEESDSDQRQFRSKIKSRELFIKFNENITIDQIDHAISNVVHEQFKDQLFVHRIMPVCGENDGTVKWIFTPRESETIAGYAVYLEGNKISFKHPLNIISIWMLELTRDRLAVELRSSLVDSSTRDQIAPHPELIDTFNQWLHVNATGESEERIQSYYRYQVRQMPGFVVDLEGDQARRQLDS